MLKGILTQYKGLFREHTDLRLQENISRRVRLRNGNLVQNDITDISGVSARVYKNGIYGFSSSAKCSDESIRAVLETAERNAMLMNKYIKPGIQQLPHIPAGSIPLTYKIKDFEQKYYIDFTRELDEYITKKYPNLAKREVSVRTDVIEKVMTVSDGADGHTLMVRSHVDIGMAVIASDGSPVELDDYYGGRGYPDEVFAQKDWLYAAIDKIYSELMDKKEGGFSEAGYKDIILCPDLAGMLAHEAVGHTCEADMVMNGSVAGNNLNKQVASELITLVDFAHTAFNKETPIPIYVDDEGTLGEDAVIIKDGILKGFMHNRESSAHFGAKPTGNARAFTFSDEPIIRMRNTFIMPGKDKREDMIAAIDDGYMLSYPQNGQGDTTGEFMLGAGLGYEIKKGKVCRPIRGATISGMAFELLKTVDMLTDEINWRSGGMCGKKTRIQTAMGGPAIKCKAHISGR